jgi:AMP-polyphosphate phosphotransferase
LIPANNKPYGRVAVFTIMIDVLGKGLSLKPRPLDPKVAEIAKQLIDLA